MLMGEEALRMKRALIVLVLLSVPAGAAEYRCTVTKKLTAEQEDTAAELAKWKPYNLIEETAEGAFMSRCSWSQIHQKVTCDRYKADRMEVDSNVKIKKFYFFRSQFNLQVFTNLNFIEDNGRGSISFGKCELTAP